MSEYRDALQPIAGGSRSVAIADINSTKPAQILKELAPQLLHPRILKSSAFVNAASSSASSVSSSLAASSSNALSLSNANNAFITLARLSRSAVPLTGGPSLSANTSKASKQKVTSTDLRILEGVDRLLSLPIPSGPSSGSINAKRSSIRANGHLPTLTEADEDENDTGSIVEADEDVDEDVDEEEHVALLAGFNATIPSASLRKLARRRRRAGISEQQLGMAGGELGLKERGQRARGLLADQSDGEATPRRRTMKGKRRSSFMPQPLRSRHDDADALKDSLSGLSKTELEQEAKEVVLDKEALDVRRKLVLDDLKELEAKIEQLMQIREELGDKLLQLKEEELELDDELEGVQELITQVDARTTGKAISSTSSRRRRGPAFLPSEHDELPPNIAFMTITPATPITDGVSITSLDFDEPYGNLVTSTSAPDSRVRVYDLRDGEELATLSHGHKEGTYVKSVLVEGTLCMTGGQDGKISLWDLPTAIEEGQRLQDEQNTKSNYVGASSNASVAKERALDDDVFFSASSANRGNGRPEGSYNDEKDDLLPDLDTLKTRTAVTTTPSPGHIRALEGHSKDVTCLSYEDTSLVSGSSDKTLRLWDLNTGQCVVTMDILWAISNPLPVESEGSDEAPSRPEAPRTPSSSAGQTPSISSLSPTGSVYENDYPWHSTSSSYLTPNRKRSSLSGLRRLSSQSYNLTSLANASPTTPTGMANPSFVQPTPTFSDGSWEMYQDFVGGLQLWSYALASGSADGCVRMWDTRTGQSVRSLIGHTAPITCLQFDSFHLVSGSLDKSVRVWDLRTGRTIDTLRYDGPVTALQFDSRRILVAGGTDAVQVFNRTTLQQSELIVNGHTSPVERLRFMDKYLATGSRDATVKIWSLA